MADRPAPAVDRWQDLMGHLLEGGRSASGQLLAQALHSEPSRSAVLERLVTPCLREIGRLWQFGEITVPEEHLASETLMAVLQTLRAPPSIEPQAPWAVVSCAPTEGHVLPAAFARDLLEDAGWRVCFLGASMPAEELAAFVRRRKPQLLVLTTTRAQSLPGAVAVTRALCSGPGGTAILVGGAGVQGLGQASDVYADALGRDLAELVPFAGGLTAPRRPRPAPRISPGAGKSRVA